MQKILCIIVSFRCNVFSRRFVAAAMIISLSCMHAKAWVYPEHRQLLYMAIKNLSPEFRVQLDMIWMKARSGHETRLSESIIDSAAGRMTIDYASWSAIAGDHSCSPGDMLNTILTSKWIFNVERTSEKLAQKLAQARTESQRVNALRSSDLQLMNADASYVSRAGSSNVHFLLPRSLPNVTLTEYFELCTAKNADPNAIAVYAWLHISAMEKATQYATNPGGPEANNLLLSALAEEAFALHFLQDAFAAGHATGSWGKPAVKKGTHDYYNEAGLEVETWNGRRMIAHGDAYLESSSARLIAKVVSASLEQLINASSGQWHSPVMDNSIHPAPLDSNICTMATLPQYRYDTTMLFAILRQTPIVGLRQGAGALLRKGSELGPFFGISAALNARSISGGFGKQQVLAGSIAGLEANMVFGLGLEGVLNKSGDGLIFLQVGWKQENASSNNFEYADPSLVSASAIASAVPARSGYNVRLRMPYYLIPGDLLIAAPILSLVSPKTLNHVALNAVNGGLLKLQSGILTSVGRFQFTLGREIGMTFYGLKRPRDYIIIPTGGGKVAVVEYRSTKIDIPVFEYMPMRTFSENQASGMLVQVGFGVDIPSKTQILIPAGDPVPPLKNIWYAGLKIIFNWRRYL